MVERAVGTDTGQNPDGVEPMRLRVEAQTFIGRFVVGLGQLLRRVEDVEEVHIRMKNGDVMTFNNRPGKRTLSLQDNNNGQALKVVASDVADGDFITEFADRLRGQHVVNKNPVFALVHQKLSRVIKTLSTED